MAGTSAKAGLSCVAPVAFPKFLQYYYLNCVKFF